MKQAPIARRRAGRRVGTTGAGTAALGFFAVVLLSGVTTFLRQEASAAARVEQPIAFNHRLHVEDQGLECGVCHPFNATGISSGFPSAATCAMCHAEAQGESAEERALVELLAEGRELVWRSLFRQPPHVFYSHRRHVAVAGLECSTCHGAIGTSERPPEQGAPLSMETCIRCHERSQASTDCTACHR